MEAANHQGGARHGGEEMTTLDHVAVRRRIGRGALKDGLSGAALSRAGQTVAR
jgi:hypothetical protein